MKLAAAVIIAGTLLSIGFCMETSRKESAKTVQESNQTRIPKMPARHGRFALIPAV